MRLLNKTVVFDLDGTLIDTLPDIHEALKSTAERFGLKNLPIDLLRKLLSHGSRKLIESQFDFSEKEFSEQEIKSATKYFIKYYRENISTYSKLFPGILDCLNWLKSESATITICTNKYEKLAKKLIYDLDISNYFTVITGSDTFKFRKPDPYHIKHTIKLAKGNLNNSIMIGDSITDFKTAKNVQIPIIIVGWGYSDIPARTIGGDSFINKGSELIRTIERFLI